MAHPTLPDRVNVIPGEPVTIAVPGHGIGGYLWSAEVEAGSGEVEEAAFEVPDSVGAGATAHFRLNWLGSGRGVVKLSLKRPWEEQAVEVHRIEVCPA
jgi:predicted secreted protein